MAAEAAAGRGWAALLLALVACGVAAQEGAPYRLAVETLPRGFGLGLGDVVTRHLELILPPELSRDGRRHRLQLPYRIINLDPDYPRIRLPALQLAVTGGSPVAVPAEPLSVTWLSPPEGPPGPLQPDRLPAAAAAPVAGALAAGAALVLGAGLLGWLHGPLALGPARPFQRCLGRLRRRSGATWDQAACRAALREVHAALDASAGATLLASDLPAFLDRRPRFRPVAQELADFFRISSEVFYREQPCPVGRSELLVLARRCRDAERGLLG